MIGKQILNYQVEKLLGEGGMGSVYLGVHTQLGRRVAIKVLHSSYAANPHIRERFKNEASTMANLQHPHIVSLYDYLEQADGLFLIMEFVDGIELDKYIRTITGPIPEVKTIDLFSHILDGFAYAHRKGVVHRDIKPSNIMIAGDGQVKILDFGIAKIVSAEASHKLTRTGMRMGTVLYMSPEQVRGQTIDQRSDVYSLGVVLFEMLTGRCPYNEQELSEYDVNVKIVNEPLPRAKEFYPGVSDAMQAIIDKATAKRPEDRFQRCEDFKAALLRIGQQEEPVLIPAAERTEPTKQPAPEVHKAVQPPPPAPPKRRRSGRGVFWLFLLLILAGGVFFAYKNQKRIKKVFVKEYNEADLKDRLNRYYRALETHNFENVEDFYAPQLTKYFNRKNVTLPAIRVVTEKYWRGVEDEDHRIDWTSFTWSRDRSDNYVVKYEMDYQYRKVNAEWKTDRGKAVVKFDASLKIIYISSQ